MPEELAPPREGEGADGANPRLGSLPFPRGTPTPIYPGSDAAPQPQGREEMAEELLYEVREKATSVTIKEFSSEGARVTFNFQGEVKGRYSGNRMETADALLKPDGTGEFEVRALDQTAQGDLIMVAAKGKTTQTGPTTIRIEAAGGFRTSSKPLAWLNTTKARAEGTFNPVTGEVTVKAYAVK